MKRTLITFLLLVALTGIAFAWLQLQGQRKEYAGLHSPSGQKLVKHKVEYKELKSRRSEAKRFAASQGFNEEFCFMIDMRLHSGQNRFFVYDLKKDSILSSGLVTHGRCNEDWLEGRKYGNTPGCGCTSLGKYKVGYSYQGRFGLAFKLYGLEKTNDKAFERFVVLHSHECVPEGAIEEEICQSDGCPTVSPGYLKTLEPRIKGSAKPVLLWIFESRL